MRPIDAIIIHCSDTPTNMDVGLDEITDWHVEGNGWRDVGYHYIIRQDGGIERGRPEEEPGAHVRGHNKRSLGVCLVGGRGTDGQPDCNYTVRQWWALERLVTRLKASYQDAIVRGHRDYDAGKACPCFDVSAWWYGEVMVW